MNANYRQFAVLVRQHTRYIAVRNPIRQDEKHAHTATDNLDLNLEMALRTALERLPSRVTAWPYTS